MTLYDLIEQATVTARDKGFDLQQHETQLLLIASEIREALHHVSPGTDETVQRIRNSFIGDMASLELYRSHVVAMDTEYQDTSEIPEMRSEYVEELADAVIRICSYAGGNGMTIELIRAIKDKMEKNAKRPVLHGKGF
jgi:NTP pyrophosphatase (non-canonical NTP hydrolase)